MGRGAWLILTIFPLFFGCLPVVSPSLELEDTVIETRTVWQGEVRIRGVVTVKKEGELIILPGTRVVFEPLDLDGDGIGDSELLVEGALIAEGTATEPILLTSGADQPAPADWKYLYLDFARQARLSHLIAEYAYSGVQIHFCKARVTDSEFRFNIDGVRFSTVNLELRNNLIHHNRHGLRFEERRSTARIHGNSIRDNEIGIFVVTRSDGGALIEQNNITASRSYQVKFGLEQHGDVDFPRNWWGMTDPALLQESFFDQRYDSALGRASASTPAQAPFPGLP